MTIRFVSKDFGPIIEAAIRQALPKIQAEKQAESAGLSLAAIAALGLARIGKGAKPPTMADIYAEEDELRAIQKRAAGARQWL